MGSEQDNSIAKIFTEAYIAEQKLDLPVLATTKTCSGATYIVTGANIGLGFEAAKHLAKLGAAKVILAVRNVQAGETAKADIKAEAKVAEDVLEVWQLDLSDYDSIKAFAKKANDQLDRLDTVIENAGISADKWTTAGGHEAMIQVNALGTTLLGVLLLPKLIESGRRFDIVPRLVQVGSEVSFTAKGSLDKVKDNPMVKLDDEKVEGANGRYQLSKLIQLLAYRELASLLPVSRTGVIINLVNPGLCKTSLLRGYDEGVRTGLEQFTSGFARTAEMGSRTLLHGVAAGKESHGHYLSACEDRESQVPDWITNAGGKQVQKRVWDDVVKVIESAAPGCVKSLV